MTFEDWWASEYRGHTGQGYAKRAWEAAQSAEKEKRKSLTDEDIKTLWVENLITVSEEQGCIRFARAIERRINGEEE